MTRPVVAIAPSVDKRFVDAVKQARGDPVDDPTRADALIWVDPADPNGLGDMLKKSPARWVQLPFAGIESFFEAKVIDPGRTWTCAKGVYGPATAEHALALILASARCLTTHARADSWRRGGGGFGAPERRLKDSTVLIVGTGGVGRALVPLLQPLGPRILAVNRSGKPLDGAEITETTENLPRLLEQADFVVLAAALTNETRGLFDGLMLEYMKEDAWLVNVARGGLIVTDDLVKALDHRTIGGAALDVTDPEPVPDSHLLWFLDNVLITPHVANTWDMALPELTSLVCRNVGHFAQDEPLEGLVDVAAGY
jgi:phosphoglycerate dehydrogenase-like enzyme